MSTYEPEIPDESEQLDDDQFQPEDSLIDRGVADALDEGYSPPEKYSNVERYGEHETLEERLDEEVPDVQPDADDLDPEADRQKRADPDGDIDEILDSEYLGADGEVGAERAGRLVDPNEGIGEDVDKELVGDAVGIDGGAAGAEEAAVHVVPDDADLQAEEEGRI